MTVIKKLKNLFFGTKSVSVEDEFIKMIAELEEERKKFRPGSVKDRRIDEKTGLLLELADRLKLNIRNK